MAGLIAHHAVDHRCSIRRVRRTSTLADRRQPPREPFTGWLGAARPVLQTILAMRVTAAGQVEELVVEADATEVTDYDGIEFGTEYRVQSTEYRVLSTGY